MRNLLASLLLIELTLSTPALSATYVCTIKDVKQLDRNGIVSNTPFTKIAAENYKSIIWDEDSGLLRMRRSDKSEAFRREMRLIQRGTSQNSSIGLSVVEGSVSTVMSTITVQSWIPITAQSSIPSIPFVFIEYELYSGICDLI